MALKNGEVARSKIKRNATHVRVPTRPHRFEHHEVIFRSIEKHGLACRNGAGLSSKGELEIPQHRHPLPSGRLQARHKHETRQKAGLGRRLRRRGREMLLPMHATPAHPSAPPRFGRKKQAHPGYLVRSFQVVHTAGRVSDAKRGTTFAFPGREVHL